MCVFFAHMFAEQNKIQSGNARLTSSNAPPGTSASRTSTGATAIRIVQITATRTALRPLTTLHTPLRLRVRSFFNVSIASFIIYSCNLVWRVPLSPLRTCSISMALQAIEIFDQLIRIVEKKISQKY